MPNTPNYGWTYPTNGGDVDIWGSILNSCMVAIDASLKSVSDTLTTLVGRAAPTGAVMDFLLPSAPAGWIRLTGTIGSASSGATYANAAAQALFTTTWQFTGLSIADSAGNPTTRGASAAADWSANKRLSLPDQNGKFRRSNGGASGDIGDVQAQSIQSHTHSIARNTSKSGRGDSDDLIAFPPWGTSTTNGTTGSTGDTETRPENIAYLTCIKL